MFENAKYRYLPRCGNERFNKNISRQIETFLNEIHIVPTMRSKESTVLLIEIPT